VHISLCTCPRVDEHAVGAVPAVADPQLRDVLVRLALHDEDPRPVAGDVDDGHAGHPAIGLGDRLQHLPAPRQPLEHRVGALALRVEPRLELRAAFFHPAIGIADFDAVQRLDDLVSPRRRRRGNVHCGGCGGGHTGGEQEEKKKTRGVTHP
jgi:hypothetical protein